MAQDIGLDLETASPAVTLLSADLVDTVLSALTASVDLGTPTPLEVNFELTLTFLAGTVTGFVYLKAYWSIDGIKFTSSDPDNGEVVAISLCKASSDVNLINSFPARSRYVKFALDNQSNGASVDGTSSNTALKLRDAFGDQA